MQPPKTRPFLKWAGNKYRLVSRIRALLPHGHRLLEPFCGSAAVFMNTSFPEYLLADVNADLISLYQLLKKDGAAVIAEAKSLFVPELNQKEAYYELRERFNQTADKRQRALLFLYLNRHGYNGLCRYNAKGIYNVPFGRYQKPYFPESELQEFIEKAQTAEFLHADYRTVFAVARKGDVIYCDPPYVPISRTANFTSYSSGTFTEQDQRQLAELARETAERGIPVLISNHHNPLTLSIYTGAAIERFPVQRLISCQGNRRGRADELLALFEPIQ